mgnify:FL=1
MNIYAFTTHKAAERYKDCQDSFAINMCKKSFAMSDGMTQSIFPDLWSRILVEEYVNSDDPDSFGLNIKNYQDRWLERVNKELEALKEAGVPSWRLENFIKLRQGAGATFVGIVLDDRFNWHGHILGDTALIEVDAENNVSKIHITPPNAGFGNTPEFFDSMTTQKGNLRPIGGIVGDGCKIMLVSDPIGELLYTKKKDGTEKKYVEALLAVNTHEEFCSLIDKWRDEEHLHNDDSTYLCISNCSTSRMVVDSLSELRYVESKILEHEGALNCKKLLDRATESEKRLSEKETEINKIKEDLRKQDKTNQELARRLQEASVYYKKEINNHDEKHREEIECFKKTRDDLEKKIEEEHNRTINLNNKCSELQKILDEKNSRLEKLELELDMLKPKIVSEEKSESQSNPLTTEEADGKKKCTTGNNAFNSADDSEQSQRKDSPNVTIFTLAILAILFALAGAAICAIATGALDNPLHGFGKESSSFVSEADTSASVQTIGKDSQNVSQDSLVPSTVPELIDLEKKFAPIKGAKKANTKQSQP